MTDAEREEYLALTIPCPDCKGDMEDCPTCRRGLFGVRGRIFQPCIDCGEPSCGSCPGGRCRDCDMEYIAASGSCRECTVMMWREEYGGPIALQHAAGCSLANDPDYAPRTPEELNALRVKKYGYGPVVTP